MVEIGSRIRHLRLLKDYSQENMAVALKMSKNSYSKIERNEVKYIHDKLQLIADILEVPLAFLLFGDDIKKLLNIVGGG